MPDLGGFRKFFGGVNKLTKAVTEYRRTLAKQLGALAMISQQLAELRGLVHQQSDFTVEALHRAGWETEDGAAQQRALQRTLQLGSSRKDIIVGPWTGEVGFELMYWIPFLTWLATSQGISGERMIVVSRGGAAPWYRHLTKRYVDILDLVSPEEFRTRTAGPKKQRTIGEFDKEILSRVKGKQAPADAETLHPSVMYRLFVSLWRRRTTVEMLDAFTTYQPLSTDLTPPPAGLPKDYVAAKFYFSKAFPENKENREFVADVLRTMSRQAPVVLMSAGIQLDEHHDFQAADGQGVVVVDPHKVPQKNLELQTSIIRGSRGFVGTYGGFSYLAPFYGIPSLSFFSDRTRFESHHLDIAYRVFADAKHGRFVALDRRDLELVQPAVDRWMTR